MKEAKWSCDADCWRYTDRFWHSEACRQKQTDDLQRAVNDANRWTPVNSPPLAAKPAPVAHGWQCPVCKTVWAPTVQACLCVRCAKKDAT